MGIDAKGIRVCVWRILVMFMSICFRFVQKHPYLSGISSFFFFLYTYHPSIFKFLIYSSPVLVCTVVFVRNLLNSERPKTLNFEDGKKNHGIFPNKLGSVEDDPVVKRSENSYMQEGVRRNVNENKKELDELFAQTVSIDEKLKEIQEEKASSSLDCIESSSCNAEKVQTLDKQLQVLDSEPLSSDPVSRNGSDDWSRKVFGSAADLEALNLEEAEYEDEEEAQEDGNKAVEWTEDDQKNLMDLGTSEIERNKRLESLIAKRRARKTLSMQVQRNLIDLDIGPPPGLMAPILIARSNPFNLPYKLNEPEVLAMPGSAPSVLLPMTNPFDIPYDPLEEKPNLTGDAFQQEFMTVQKDPCFCRHESFSLGPSFPVETKQNRHDPNLNPFFVSGRRALEEPVFSRFRRQSDENLVEQLLSLECESFPQSESARDYDHVEQEGRLFDQVVNSVEHNHYIDENAEYRKVEGKENDHDMESRSADGSKVHMEPGLFIDNNGVLNPSSSSETNQNLSANKYEVPKYLEPRMELENIGQRNEPFYDSSPSASEEGRMEEQLFYDERIPGHTPSFSIASDMLVEVSEGGSPPLTIGTGSPFDGESATDEGDMDKEITSGSEEMWGASSHLSGIEENESSSRSVHEICEENILGVGFSGINQKSKHSIAPLLLQGSTVEQATLSTSLFSSPRTELPEEGEDQKICDEVHEDVIEEIEEPVSSISSDESLNEILALQVPQDHNLTEKLVVHPSGDDAFKNSEEPYNPPEKSSGNVNFIQSASDLILNINIDTESLQSIQNKAGEAQPSIMSESAGEAGPKSVEYIEKNYEEPQEHESNLESHKPSKENDISESNKTIERQFNELTQHESIADESRLTEARENRTSNQDSEGTQDTVEIGISRVNLNSDDSAITSTLPEIVVEQIVFNSSSSSSPKSVLPENVFKDQDHLSSFDHMIQVDVQHSATEDSSLLETFPENLGMTMPQIEQQLMENPMNFSSNFHHDVENMQEQSSPPERSPEEANIINKANQLLIQDKEGESQNIIRPSPIIEVSQPSEEVNASSAKTIEEKFKKVAECDATLCPSCPTENIDINILETIRTEEENTTLSKLAEDKAVMNSLLAAKEGEEPYEHSIGKLAEECNGWKYKSAGDEQGESQILIREEAILGPMDKELPTQDIAGESEKITEHERMLGQPSNPVGETHNQIAIKDDKDSKLLIDDLTMEVTQDLKVNPTI